MGKFNEFQIDAHSLLYATGQVALISVESKEGKIIFANRLFLDISGYKEEELIGKSHEFLKADTSFDDDYQFLRKTIESGSIWRGELKHKAKSGKTYWVDMSVVPVRNSENIVDHFLWVGFFINSRKEFEDKQQKIIDELTESKKDLKKYELALNGTSDPVVITDSAGHIMYANPAVEAVTGYKKEDVLGKNFDSKDLWGGLMSPEFYDKLWKRIRDEKKSFSGTIRNKRKDRTEYYVLSTISPILGSGGNVEFYVIIERDITEEKEIEKSKTEFVSLASHQLRTPLSTINWYTEMLLAGDAGSLSENQAKYLEEIYAGSQRMVELVDDLLNISRFEMGKLKIKLSKINITPLVYSVLEEQKKQINERKIQFISTVGTNIPELTTDEKLLRMVFQNLISNAIKYTMIGGKIELDIVYQEKEKMIFIKVADNGLGIPQAERKNIFKKMYRAENVREADTEGTGLGLYIVKTIVDKFGGEISFESEENQGTTFSVKLPTNIEATSKNA